MKSFENRLEIAILKQFSKDFMNADFIIFDNLFYVDLALSPVNIEGMYKITGQSKVKIKKS